MSVPPVATSCRPVRRCGNSRFRKTHVFANRPPRQRRSRLAANRRVVLLGPFGEPLTSPTGVGLEFPFRFSTHYTDQETGLVYAKRRYYSPSSGRWLSKDPIEERGGANLFEYAHNDGINRIDPFGLIDDFGYDSGLDYDPGPPPLPSGWDQVTGYSPGVNYAEGFEFRFPNQVRRQKATFVAAVEIAVKKHCGELMWINSIARREVPYRFDFIPNRKWKKYGPPTEAPGDIPMDKGETSHSLGAHGYRIKGDVKIDSTALSMSGHCCYTWTAELIVLDTPGKQSGESWAWALRLWGGPVDSPPVQIASWPMQGTVCCASANYVPSFVRP